jgi:hypothetical protein
MKLFRDDTNDKIITMIQRFQMGLKLLDEKIFLPISHRLQMIFSKEYLSVKFQEDHTG